MKDQRRFIAKKSQTYTSLDATPETNNLCLNPWPDLIPRLLEIFENLKILLKNGCFLTQFVTFWTVFEFIVINQ